MLNGDSGYGNGQNITVTGADKPSAPSLMRWFCPVTVWLPRRGF